MTSNCGPWNDYEMVSPKVVRKKTDQPLEEIKIQTNEKNDFEALMDLESEES